MALTEKLVRETYAKLKSMAAKNLSKGEVHKALLNTHLAAYTNYTFWLSFYDEEIEQLLKNISNTIIKKDVLGVRPNRCVMFDSLSRYRGGLTVQYVKAIVASGWDLLYVTEQDLSAPHHVELFNFLKQFENITLVEIPKNYKGVRRLQFVYDQVLNYQAERVYIHSSSSDSLFPAVCYALPKQVQKFYIDIADHGFRMGMSACDYSFQFRSLGCSIAVQRRNINADQLLFLPFYPVMDHTVFRGIPEECKGKVLILSGGIFWKIVDGEDTFFKLCQQILEQNPQAVILYPGGGDSTYVKNKISEYGISDRFFLLGWRDDICELFRQSDIFLNTYPHGGGTMSIYAAHLKKPILSYVPDGQCSNPIEKFVCQRSNVKISSVGTQEFLFEANKLINDAEYRETKAELTYQCVIPEESFNSLFKEMSINHHNMIPFGVSDSIEDKTKQTLERIAYHNKQGEFQMRIVALAGLNSITFRSEFLKPFVKKIFPKLKRVISERGFHFNRV